MSVHNFQVMVPFCSAASEVDMVECMCYKPVGPDNKMCANADPATGFYDGQVPCLLDPCAFYDRSKSVQSITVLTSAIAEGNASVLGKHGITPDTPGVKFYRESQTWILRLKWKGAPPVDFCASKNKWRNVRTQQMFYGDANQLITYLRSGGKRGGSTTPKRGGV